jgi:hypothetical protein
MAQLAALMPEGRDRAVEPSLLNFLQNLHWGELPLVTDSFRIEAFTTKIGLSSDAVTGFSSLRDELPNFARSENDRQSFDDSLDHVSRF